MQITRGLMSAINTNFRSAFVRGLRRTDPRYKRITMTVNSTTETEVYPMLGTLGTLREWIGERVAQELAAQAFEIRNKPFEKTLKVPKSKIQDDQFGIYTVSSEGLGDAANRHPDILTANVLENGFSNLCLDGKAFFATDHPYADGTQWSNKGTTAFSGAALQAARQQMMSLKDDGGELLDIVPDLLVIPPALEETVRIALTAEWIPSDAGTATVSNPYRGLIPYMVWPRLADSNNWYLFDTTQVIRALIFQQRQAPQFVSKFNPDDDNVFYMNEFVWGVDYRGNVGYGLPQLAFGSQVAGG